MNIKLNSYRFVLLTLIMAILQFPIWGSAKETSKDSKTFGTAPNPFAVPGGKLSGDTFPIYKDGVWHLFHMQMPNIAHYSSRNLIDWKEHPLVVSSGTPSFPHASGLATGCVVEHNGRYYCFVTCTQKICLLISDDLENWVRWGRGPVLCPDGKLYDPGNFRDPYVFYNEEEKCWWMLFGTRVVDPEKPAQRNGCVGLAKSEDLLNWKLAPPLWKPGNQPFTDCPQVIQENGKWFLLYLQRAVRYRIADSLSGPWQRGTTRDIDTRMASAGSRVASDGKRWLSFPWVVTPKKPDDFSEWGYGGPWAVPRQWAFHDDGSITIAPADEIIHAMRNAKAGGKQPLDDAKVLTGKWKLSEGKNAQSEDPSGGTLLLPETPDDFYFETDVTFDSEKMDVRLMMNTNENFASGYVFLMRPESDMVSLRGMSYWNIDRDLIVQPATLQPGYPVKLRVFRSGDIVEIFIGDQSALTHRLFRYSGGNLALEFIDGTGRFENMFLRKLKPMKQPVMLNKGS